MNDEYQFTGLDWIGILIILVGALMLMVVAGCIHDVIYAEEASEELILWLVR